MRGNEIVNGHPIRVYDNGGTTFDRYTVVYMDTKGKAVVNNSELYECLGMSSAPFHPQGFGVHSAAMVGRHLGKRIEFASLPEDCQKAVIQDCKGY